jgi:hypothetical protein
MAASSLPALSHQVTQHGVHDEAGEIKIRKLGGSFALGNVRDRAVLFARYEGVEMDLRR